MTGTRITAEQKTTFVEAIKARRTVTQASSESGIGVQTVYRHLETDPDFAQAYADARAEQADWVRGKFWEIAADDKHKWQFGALERLARTYVPEFRDVPTDTGEGANDRIAEALERFTAAILTRSPEPAAALPRATPDRPDGATHDPQ